MKNAVFWDMTLLALTLKILKPSVLCLLTWVHTFLKQILGTLSDDMKGGMAGMRRIYIMKSNYIYELK
jgi:hypothetical protein